MAKNALFQYFQQNAKEKTTFLAKNIKIVHWLLSSLANVFGFFLNIIYFFTEFLFAELLFYPNYNSFQTFFKTK